MKTKQNLLVVTLLAFIALLFGASAKPQTLRSTDKQSHLLELFSSEGCSSCPSADAWLASMRRDGGLWKTFVPLEFHVDYWNRLGWVDRFSKDSFTQRQRQYAASWGSTSVYTPGFVLDGREWKQDRGDSRALAMPGKSVGILEAVRQGDTRFELRFTPVSGDAKVVYWVHGALLGNGLKSKVTSGENSGRELRHEFVVLALHHAAMQSSKNQYVAELSLQPTTSVKAESRSVAFWVTDADHPMLPVQAVGGDL